MKIRSLFILLLLIGVTNSCALISLNAKKYITVDEGAIPEEFGSNENEILLIKLYKGQPILNILVKNKFNFHYSGKKEYTPKEADIDTIYDKEIYRYVFLIEQFFKQDAVSNSSVYTASYSILDRRINYKYRCFVTSAFFGQMSRAYAKQLDDELIKKMATW